MRTVVATVIDDDDFVQEVCGRALNDGVYGTEQGRYDLAVVEGYDDRCSRQLTEGSVVQIQAPAMLDGFLDQNCARSSVIIIDR